MERATSIMQIILIISVLCFPSNARAMNPKERPNRVSARVMRNRRRNQVRRVVVSNGINKAVS